jgi:hypothetical protein
MIIRRCLSVSARSRAPVLIGERDIPGKQCLEVRHALRGGQLGKEAAQVGVGFELVAARGLHEAVETGTGLRSLDGVGEKSQLLRLRK